MSATPKLQRTAFKTSRLLDFCNQKELTAQTGHPPESWPLVALKELVDNALDACEEAGVVPDVTVTLDDQGIGVEDNGPGIPAEVIHGVLDFSVRVSSREAYVAPDRGAQGNALKTIVAMPFVLDGERGCVDIEARGVRHRITMRVDRIRQEPVIERVEEPTDVSIGTKMRICWPDSAKLNPPRCRAAFCTNRR
jgi:DNA topoisomerase VI subunit B